MTRPTLKRAAPLALSAAYVACLYFARTGHPAAFTAACLAPLIAWAALAAALIRAGRGPL